LPGDIAKYRLRDCHVRFGNAIFRLDRITAGAFSPADCGRQAGTLVAAFLRQPTPKTEGKCPMAPLSAAAPVVRKPLYTSLFVQVLVALLLGIVLGHGRSRFRHQLEKF